METLQPHSHHIRLDSSAVSMVHDLKPHNYVISAAAFEWLVGLMILHSHRILC